MSCCQNSVVVVIMTITVVITNFQRPNNVTLILDALRHQSIKPTIFVWDNSPSQAFGNSQIDWLIQSSVNAKCSPRWWMASQADTDYVVVMDDDLVPSDPSVLAMTLESAERASPFAVGVAGVILEADKTYVQCRHIEQIGVYNENDTQVDILKGRYFCASVSRIKELRTMGLEVEDDILVSAELGKGAQTPHTVVGAIAARFKNLPTGAESRYGRGGHWRLRESARRKYF